MAWFPGKISSSSPTGNRIDEVRTILGDALPAENILSEPAKRDTAPAIALGIGWVAARDVNAVMLVLPAGPAHPG